MHTDAHGIAIHVNTAGNAQETISTGTRNYQTSVLGVNAAVRLWGLMARVWVKIRAPAHW